MRTGSKQKKNEKASRFLTPGKTARMGLFIYVGGDINTAKESFMKTMAKKYLFAAVLALIAAGGVCAQTVFGISGGVGGFIGGDFGGGFEDSFGTSRNAYYCLDAKMLTETPYFGGGAYAFMDLTYLEFSLGIFSGSGTMKMTAEEVMPGFEPTSSEDTFNYSIHNFNIGLLGKYPFRLNKGISVFPLLGIEYQITTAFKSEDSGKADDTGDMSAVWFKFGFGMDFSYTEKIYIRLSALYGIRSANKFEKDAWDEIIKAREEYWKDIFSISFDSSDAKPLLGHGLTVKLAIGYRF